MVKITLVQECVCVCECVRTCACVRTCTCVRTYACVHIHVHDVCIREYTMFLWSNIFMIFMDVKMEDNRALPQHNYIDQPQPAYPHTLS